MRRRWGGCISLYTPPNGRGGALLVHVCCYKIILSFFVYVCIIKLMTNTAQKGNDMTKTKLIERANMKNIEITKLARVEAPAGEYENIVAFQMIEYVIDFFGNTINGRLDTKIMTDGRQL